MKHAWKLALLGLLAMLAFTGCGAAGDDGAAFVSLSWVYGATIDFEDPSFPAPAYIGNGTYYPAIVGRWDYEYISAGNTGTLWYGYYTTYVNEGEDGGLFSAGDDGEDIYFQMFLGSGGPSFYAYDYPASERSLQDKAVANTGLAAQLQKEAAIAAENGVAPAADAKLGVSSVTAPKFSRTDDQAWEIVQTVTSGKYSVTLRANSVKLP